MGEFKYKIENNKLIIEECPDGILKVEYTDKIKFKYDEVYLCEGIKKIDEGAFFAWGLGKVHLPNSLKEIGNQAFYDCNRLEMVDIPSSVEYIGEEAFAYCGMLEKINIPNNVKEISNGMFNECNFLKSISLPEKIEKIGSNAFCNCISLQKINIPKSLKYIDEEAFYSCSSLSNVIFNDNLEFIGKHAFCECDSLKKVVFKSKLEKLEDTFTSCTKLKKVFLPEGIKVLNGTFNNCKKLKKINLPSSLEVIDDNAFASTSLSKVFIPSKVKKIGFCSFRKSFNLKDVVIGSGVKEIGESAFELCEKLKKIHILDNVLKIGSDAFADCFNLENVILSKNIEEIPENCFKKCYKLKKIEIPEGVKRIKDYSFTQCDGLKEVYVPTSLDYFENNAFYFSNMLKNIIINDNGESKVINLNNKRVLFNTDYKLFLFDKDTKIFSFYNNSEYIEFRIEDLKKNKKIEKLIDDQFIRYDDFIKAYYWSKKRIVPSLMVIENMPLKDIDNFYLNNNHRKWKELINNSGIKNAYNTVSFFKLCYVLGLFSDSSSISDKAFNFIKENIINKLSEEKIHSRFDGFDLNNGFNEEYAEFFIKYYNQDDFMIDEDEYGDDYDFMASSYNNFNNVKKVYPNKTLHTNREVDILLPRHVMDAIRCVVYEDVDEGNEELAEVVGKYGYNKEQFEVIQDWYNKGKSIINSDKKLFVKEDNEKEGITYKLLNKDDPLIAVLGNITNCCQVVNGVGESCVKYGMISNNSSFITFNYKDKIIGQAWVWYDEKSKTICLDNIEVPSKYIEKINNNKYIQDSFIKCLLRLNEGFKEEMSKRGLLVDKVTIGKGYNDIKNLLNEYFKLVDSPSKLKGYDGYSDASSQYEIIETKKNITR